MKRRTREGWANATVWALIRDRPVPLTMAFGCCVTPTAGQGDSTVACQGQERLTGRVVDRKGGGAGKNLPPPPLKGVAHDLKALVDHHQETLVREATRHRSRAHAMLTQLRPGYWRVVPDLTSARRLQAARRLVEGGAGGSSRGRARNARLG
jgi:hypothetical protein